MLKQEDPNYIAFEKHKTLQEIFCLKININRSAYLFGRGRVRSSTGGRGWRMRLLLLPLFCWCEDELAAASKAPLGPVGPASETERSRLCTGGLASSCPGFTDRLIAECGTKAAGEVKEYTDLKIHMTVQVLTRAL